MSHGIDRCVVHFKEAQHESWLMTHDLKTQPPKNIQKIESNESKIRFLQSSIVFDAAKWMKQRYREFPELGSSLWNVRTQCENLEAQRGTTMMFLMMAIHMRIAEVTRNEGNATLRTWLVNNKVTTQCLQIQLVRTGHKLMTHSISKKHWVIDNSHSMLPKSQEHPCKDLQAFPSQQQKLPISWLI